MEESAPGAGNMDRSWMGTFWEAFSDCVIEMGAQYEVTGILKKPDSTFTMSGIVGGSFLDIIATEKDKAFVRDELDMIKSGETAYRRFTCLSTLGRYYRWTLVPAFENCAFSGVRGIAVDVTEQSLKEITLNWQHAIIEGNNDFISISDLGGNVLYTNPGAYKMTGYDPQSGALSPERIFTAEHMEAIRGEGLETVAAEGAWTGLGELVRADGARVPIEHNIFSVRNDQDETILIATTIRDITLFVEHEKMMRDDQQRAEAASMAKSDFLSRMSHEIRTPMNAIIGMTQIAQKSSDVERMKNCLSKIDGASRHLLALINDILDISKIEANKLELHYEIFDLRKCINNINSIIAVRAEEKLQAFNLHFDESLPKCLIGDELRFTQVIINLLGNAIKFTPDKGVISMDVGEHGREDGDCIIHVSIKDSGIGLTLEQQDRLFMPFEQGDGSITRKYGGTGLGLTICKNIVELMGGGIRVESVIGEGSAFTFTARMCIVDDGECGQDGASAEGADAGAGAAGGLESLSVLAVEVTAEKRDYILHALEAFSIQCETAGSGADGIEIVGNAALKGEPFDIVFLAYDTPDINGAISAQRITELSPASRIFVMDPPEDCIFTASDSGDGESGNNSGASNGGGAEPISIINGPITPSVLLDAIHRATGYAYAQNGGRRGDAIIDVNDLSRFTVLLVEDVDINREIVCAILEDTRINIDYAENGARAVEMFAAAPLKYDIILMDVQMPVMDGLEATRRIRALDMRGARDVAIVAMTANVFREDVDRCTAAGMNDHIAKPIDSRLLMEKLSDYLFMSGFTRLR
ncbi:MAG: ATP-binding protein [Oscillospiraceae bacterium]|nr:ATP-binding protein [Oscillospiraceae bacterium]